ncbi:hypothetical protein BGY98DRAFT_995501 [Russula aff. rugulosa BPL654]|nr:hypothetical protein BGY98DRAFT_995501 [Russula aff. rugulosa BPL654]
MCSRWRAAMFASSFCLDLNAIVREVGLYLQQDNGEAIMPRLDEGYQLCGAEALAAFEPCERAGRLVKVYHCEQTDVQSRNARSWR